MTLIHKRFTTQDSHVFLEEVTSGLYLIRLRRQIFAPLFQALLR